MLRPSSPIAVFIVAAGLVLVLGGCTPAELAEADLENGEQAGGPPPAPVGYTEARSEAVERIVRLTGSVEARDTSVVASEVAGLVVRLAAREGETVRRGEPLASLRRETLEIDLAARRADLKEAQARRELAVRTRDRFRHLFEDDIVSRERLDDAESEVVALEGRVESLAAAIAQVEDDLSRATIRAPFSGVVAREHTQVGEWLAVGAPVAELLDLEHLEVELAVPERWFGQLRVGTPAQVTFESVPGLVAQGQVAALIPRADTRARTFPVKVRFENPGHRIGSGMLAEVSLPVGEDPTAVVVPKDALVRRGERTVVYRVAEGEEGLAVEELTVTPEAGTGAWIAVSGPVAAGERVVTRGNERLQPGQPVAATPVEYPLP